MNRRFIREGTSKSLLSRSEAPFFEKKPPWIARQAAKGGKTGHDGLSGVYNLDTLTGFPNADACGKMGVVCRTGDVKKGPYET
jgi:hypothetical protein